MAATCSSVRLVLLFSLALSILSHLSSPFRLGGRVAKLKIVKKVSRMSLMPVRERRATRVLSSLRDKSNGIQSRENAIQNEVQKVDGRFSSLGDPEALFYLEERNGKLGRDFRSVIEAIEDFTTTCTVSVEDNNEENYDAVLHFLPPGELRNTIKSDIVNLGRDFAKLNDRAPSLKLTLCLTRDQRCPRFHVDKVRSRLLVTYAGPGTEYLKTGSRNWFLVPPKQLLESPVGDLFGSLRNMVAGRLSNSRYNELALTQGCEIGSAAAADVLVLKGAAWGSSNGALHRSPPLRNGEASPHVKAVLF
eukprot:jgi/Bigna1/132064/aug1.16_g6772